ncbi:MAG: AraC family transcriptional regulator [Spirochaetales bacterium]|uniref:AraC family transcriptional regulator n=1 Tax=Candidatus Thalassospirochaeta sargassi TaxID=3119039 RepID=A0AAJ1ICL3_9SPIO|nr:AraC family transcriptional regulator [Spirochaetales bacterium]
MDNRNLIDISKHRTYIEPDKSLMPAITHIGRLDFSSATRALEPHTHNGAVELCYLERGVAVFQNTQQQWKLEGGDCFVSYANELHGTGSYPLGRIKLYWIAYHTDELSRWLAGNAPDAERMKFADALGPALPRIFSGSRRMGAAIDSIIDAYLGNSSLKTIEIQTALLNLFLPLAQKKGKTRIISNEIQAVIKHIDQSLNTRVELQACADTAGISLSRFKTRFKAETGIPPGEFILRKRIDWACKLLEQEVSVTDVSIECGFSSSQYFATVFRKYMNQSPSEWLKNKVR